jgi:toxin HigB-1
MLSSFRSKVLAKAYETGAAKGLPPEYAAKIRRVLFALDEATQPDDLRQPGFGLHALSGDRSGYWSIVISRNWRITFRFEKGNVHDVDYEDYH